MWCVHQIICQNIYNIDLVLEFEFFKYTFFQLQRILIKYPYPPHCEIPMKKKKTWIKHIILKYNSCVVLYLSAAMKLGLCWRRTTVTL
jgi:hypothetical protein